MSDLHTPNPHAQLGSGSAIQNMDQYKEIWNRSVSDSNAFWLQQTKALVDWKTPPTIGQEGDFHSVEQAPFSWFSDGVLNVTTSCLDRHIETRGDKTAILWEGDSPEDTLTLSYRELLAEVCRLANVLKDNGVQKGIGSLSIWA